MYNVSMQDIANKLGVTRVSVSKALNGQPGVSDALREKIRQTASSMGYVLNKPNAKDSKMHYTFIVPKRFFLETDKLYNIIYYYLNKICVNTGHQLTSIVVNTNEEENNIFPESVDLSVINGIFLVGEIAESYFLMLAKTEIPIVAIDFYNVSLNADYILTDNYYMGYYATNYLIERGHRSIGFVGNINVTTSVNDRYFGYLKAVRRHGLPLVDEWLISNNDPVTGVYTMDVELPSRLPTAFICHCDMSAYFLANNLNKIGKSIPNDVSLVSFDNTELSCMMQPQLTSFDIDKKEIARTSFKVMNNIMNGEKKKRRHYISSELIIRDSVIDV